MSFPARRPSDRDSDSDRDHPGGLLTVAIPPLSVALTVTIPAAC